MFARRTLLKSLGVAFCSGTPCLASDAVVAHIGGRYWLGEVKAGDHLQLVLEGKPIFVRRLTPAEVAQVGAGERERSLTEWVVLSGRCTHAGCSVHPETGPKIAWVCPCHGSAFSASGAVVHGPAVRPLEQVAHRIDGLWLTLLQSGI